MKKIHAYILILAIIIPNISFAASAVISGQNEFSDQTVSPSYTLLEPLPCVAGTGHNCKGGVMTEVNIQTYILYVFKLMVAVAIFLAIVMVTWGGFKYMTSEAIPVKMDAKGTITNALLGLLGALGSYLLVVTIDPHLVDVSRVLIPRLNLGVNNSVINTGAITAALGAQAQEAMTQSAAAQTMANSLQAQASSTLQQIYSGDVTDPDQIAALEAQAQSLQDQARNYNNQATIITDQAIGNNLYQNLIAGTSMTGLSKDQMDALISSKGAEIQTNYNTAINAATLNGDTATVAQLTTQRDSQLFDVNNYGYVVQLRNSAATPVDRANAIALIHQNLTQSTAGLDQTTIAAYTAQAQTRIAQINSWGGPGSNPGN